MKTWLLNWRSVCGRKKVGVVPGEEGLREKSYEDIVCFDCSIPISKFDIKSVPQYYYYIILTNYAEYRLVISGLVAH